MATCHEKQMSHSSQDGCFLRERKRRETALETLSLSHVRAHTCTQAGTYLLIPWKVLLAMSIMPPVGLATAPTRPLPTPLKKPAAPSFWAPAKYHIKSHHVLPCLEITCIYWHHANHQYLIIVFHISQMFPLKSLRGVNSTYL